MFQFAALILSYLTSPWRGHRQLSLSSVSHLNAEGKQPRFSLAFSAQRLTLCLFLYPPPPLLSKCCLSLANSLKQLSAALSSPLSTNSQQLWNLPPSPSHWPWQNTRPELGFTSTCKWPCAVSQPACLTISLQLREAHTHFVCGSAFLQMKGELRGLIDDIISVRQMPLYGTFISLLSFGAQRFYLQNWNQDL